MNQASRYNMQDLRVDGHTDKNVKHDPRVILPITKRSRPFETHPSYLQMLAMRQFAKGASIEDPFFTVHEGIATATTKVQGQSKINFASYNYLGLNGDPRVSEAAKRSIDRYGTSVSASRLVSGERPLHQLLENALARINDTEAALSFVSGHATNVTVLGYLFGPDDLIIHDKLVHNSVLQGIRLSGADRIGFAHNDLDDLEKKLIRVRHKYQNVLIVVEGLYSMDGDYPALDELVELKNRWGCLLMVDDAHGLGVLGKTGLGIREHFSLRGGDVDIWMGTLSKTLASTGGYIAGSQALIDNLKFASPGFLYSVGLPPPNAAAALAAIEILQSEPDRVARLQTISRYFFDRASEHDIDTGTAMGSAILPAILGDPIVAVRVAQALDKQGVHAKPIIYPAVSDQTARIRFFISSDHTREMIDLTMQAWDEAMALTKR